MIKKFFKEFGLRIALPLLCLLMCYFIAMLIAYAFLGIFI